MNKDSLISTPYTPASSPESLKRDLVRDKSGNAHESSENPAHGWTSTGTQITHRKADALCQKPLSSPEKPQIDPKFIVIGEAILNFDRNFIVTKEVKGLAKKAIKKIQQEKPDLFKSLDEEFESGIPLEFIIKEEVEKTLEVSRLPGKDKKRKKERALSYYNRQAQQAEKKIDKKAKEWSTNYTTRLLLTYWLEYIKTTVYYGNLDQILCDLNELLRVIGELKTRHSFLPEFHTDALRVKIDIAIRSGRWTDVVTALEVMIRRFPKYTLASDILFLATIYLSGPSQASKHQELAAQFSSEKAFSVIGLLPQAANKAEEFSSAFPEFENLYDGLLKVKKGSGKDTLIHLNYCKDALANCKEPSPLFDLVILPALSAHMYIHKGNADPAKNDINLIKELSPTLAHYYTARLLLLKKDKDAALYLYNGLIQIGVPVYKELFDIFVEAKDLKLAVATAFAAEHFYHENNGISEASYWGLLAEDYDNQEKAFSRREAMKLKSTRKEQSKAQLQEGDINGDLAHQEPVFTNEQQEEPTSSLDDVRPTIRKQTQPSLDEESYYFELLNMIRQLEYDPRSHITPEKITQRFDDALKEHSNDLWILHSSGWWQFTQGNYDKAKRILLKGMQIALGKKVSWHVPTSNQKQSALVRTILNIFIEPFERSRVSKDPDEYQLQSRDIAAFLSAYAHILLADWLTEEASGFRNAADRLDNRRGAKALERLKTMIDSKINVVSQERFEEIKRASSLSS